MVRAVAGTHISALMERPFTCLQLCPSSSTHLPTPICRLTRSQMALSGHSSITLHTSIVTMLRSGDYKGALKLVDEALPLEQDNDTLCQLRDTLLEKLHLQEGDETDSEESTTDDEQQEVEPASASATTTATAAAAAAGGGGAGADASQQSAGTGGGDDDDDASSSDSDGTDDASATNSDEEQEQARPSPSSTSALAGPPSTSGHGAGPASPPAAAGRLALDPSSFLLTRQQRSKLRAQFGAARRQRLAAQLVMNDPLLGC